MVVYTPKRNWIKSGPGASPLLTGGHGDCLEIRARQMEIYSHPNPFSKQEELEAIAEKIKSGRIIEPGIISELLKIDRVGYKKRLCLAPELSLVAEKLFMGGKFVTETFMADFCIYRIGEIPQLPKIELASLALPLTPNFPEIFNHPLLGLNPDLSLDILLKPEYEFVQIRTSLRIPLIRDDKRLRDVPKPERDKSFHIFVVSYNGRMAESRHFKSYADRWSLQEGIKNTIKLY